MTQDRPIRPMTSADIDQCIEIGRASGLSYWSRESFADELARSDSIALVARSGEKVAGFVVGRFIESEKIAEIYNIGVRLDSKREGVGRQLLVSFEERSRKQDVNSIWLEVRASNSSAIAFYRNAEFSQMSVRKGFYANPPEDAILMSKKL
ncbi:MAG TPA: ribosomal protein S18-alanine N-acetyltransferase [Pyrinomonadaceae bacterium]|nr:ribosomal protein S18-alanine N-acetyltransferase [Pyrinomonadaceae bacterium]